MCVTSTQDATALESRVLNENIPETVVIVRGVSPPHREFASVKTENTRGLLPMIRLAIHLPFMIRYPCAQE